MLLKNEAIKPNLLFTVQYAWLYACIVCKTYDAYSTVVFTLPKYMYDVQCMFLRHS